MRKLIFLMMMAVSAIAYASNPVIIDGTKSLPAQMNKQNTEYVINSICDLGGKQLNVPTGCKLVFMPGGQLRNGTVYGNFTELAGQIGIFHEMKISGTWNAPIIYSSFFTDLSATNAIIFVFALANPKVMNTVVIEEGYYPVKIGKANGQAINIYGSMNLTLRGTIELEGNAFGTYDIIRICGNNVTIKGGGTIKGDKATHTGTDGEWGMGIKILASDSVRIEGINICDCWGDGIFVVGKSNNVTIKKCNISGCRRQGISVVSAKDVVIDRCKISGIYGTPPQCAIDVEPNKGDTTDNVVISNVVIDDCFCAMSSYGGAANAYVGNLTLKNCKISNTKYKNTMQFYHVNNLFLKRNKVKTPNETAIYMERVKKFTDKSNKLKSTTDKLIEKVRCEF